MFRGAVPISQGGRCRYRHLELVPGTQASHRLEEATMLSHFIYLIGSIHIKKTWPFHLIHSK